jgi:hypothetical protein
LDEFSVRIFFHRRTFIACDCFRQIDHLGSEDNGPTPIGTMNLKTRHMIGVIGLMLVAFGLGLGFAIIGFHLIQGTHLVIK